MGYQDVLSVLTILLLTSASVERFLEFLTKAIESLGLFSQTRKGRLAVYAERRMKPPEVVIESAPAAEDTLDSAEGDPSTLVILDPGAIPDQNLATKRFILQMSGCAIGVILCVKGDLGLFHMLKATGIAAWVDYLLTGILIGTGTEPIHSLIRFLQAKNEASQSEVASTAVVAAPAAPATEVSTSEGITAKPWIDLTYNGGLNPEEHDNRRRGANPVMIIFHHTGMHSNTPFSEVVSVFKAKGFATGFNAVITENGESHNFCRWDARGIHAKGYNDRALGLAFCGCFETNPNTPGNNADGAFGNLVPTEAQLMTGAKLIVLWALLYKIDLTQPGRLVAHHEIALGEQATSCPGSQFPFARFRNLVLDLYAEWKISDRIKSEIHDFSQKPFLFVPSKG
jgi:hypothetical protein